MRWFSNFLVIFLVVSCGNNSINPDPFSYIVTDVDGNYYHTITIGTQTWLVENLKTTKYNDSTAIPLVEDSTAWDTITTPGYCWYNNDEDTYKNSYGALYNWYTVNTGKLAPTGWHVPADAEWDTLIACLGGEYVAGGKLKEAGLAHWNSPNTGATNETGFSALPGGYRYFNSTYYSIGSNGSWWSCTERDTSNSWYRYMTCNYADVNRHYGNRNSGFSVRCIRN